MSDPHDPWSVQREALGSLIRTQRQLANLSLRELGAMTSLSNAYLSQIERGLHQPSLRVVKAVAEALGISAETLLAQAGLLADQPAGEVRSTTSTEDAIRADPLLEPGEKDALLALYRSLVARRVAN